MTKKKLVTDTATGEKFDTVFEALGIAEPKFKKGDEFEFDGKQVKVVEVVAYDRYHVKNQNDPFDSFIVLGSEVKGSE